jgi:hypothetical protein
MPVLFYMVMAPLMGREAAGELAEGKVGGASGAG